MVKWDLPDQFDSLQSTQGAKCMSVLVCLEHSASDASTRSLRKEVPEVCTLCTGRDCSATQHQTATPYRKRGRLTRVGGFGSTRGRPTTHVTLQRRTDVADLTSFIRLSSPKVEPDREERGRGGGVTVVRGPGTRWLEGTWRRFFSPEGWLAVHCNFLR